MKSLILSIILFLVSYTVCCAQGSELPSLKKEWTLKDYQKFNTYIDALPLSAYPTLKNEKTKTIFQKLIIPNYRSVLREKDTGIELKMSYLLKYQQIIRETQDKYLTAYSESKSYGVEIAHLTGVLIDSSGEVLPMVQKFIKKLDPNDQSYQIRMDGLKQMKYGIKQQLEGILLEITDVNTTPDEERIILAKYLSNAGVKLLDFIGVVDSKPIITSIEKHVTIEPNSEIKALLTKLIDKT